MTTSVLASRIREELIKAGTSKHALHKNEVTYLPKIIHADERIEAAANGRTSLGSVMLVATDRRIIFLDCKSFYTTVDELTYDVVSGVAFHVQGLFANVTLHTRAGDYSLRFVNITQAEKFVAYIETKRVEVNMGSSPISLDENVAINKKEPTVLDKKQKQFLSTHNLAVLSTIDRTGNVYGAAVYYIYGDSELYILTKSETQKARNILSHPQVAMTIVEELSYETLQFNGSAEVVNDNVTRKEIYARILAIRNLADQNTLPPVAQIQEGSFIVLKVTITKAKYSKYKA